MSSIIVSFPERLLVQLSELVEARMGLHLPRERWCDLSRGISSAAAQYGFADPQSCVEWLLSAPLTRSQVEILASHLTVGETYFFREPAMFRFLEERVLTELIATRRGVDQRLRIWSAACCTGEEPYSIAILVRKLIADLKEWNVTILATDINPRFLYKAAGGVYGEWSFRDTAPSLKERYFTRDCEGRFAIDPAITKMVRFSPLNLAEDVYPSLLNDTNAMDIIFCRNVLMYFAPERAKKVVQKLLHCMVDGGWLAPGSSEASQDLFSEFVPVNFPGAIFYRKESNQGATPTPAGPGLLELSACPARPGGAVMPELIRGSDFMKALPPPLTRQVAQPEMAQAQPQLYKAAVALYEQGLYAEAVKRLSEHFAQDEQDVGAMALMARALANQGMLLEALAWSEKAIRADKLNSGYCYLRGNILQEQGNLDEAAVSLKRALYLDPDFVLAHFSLGNLALRQEKLNEANRHFSNALSVLSGWPPEEVLPESEGLTAGRLSEIIRTAIEQSFANENSHGKIR